RRYAWMPTPMPQSAASDAMPTVANSATISGTLGSMGCGAARRRSGVDVVPYARPIGMVSRDRGVYLGMVFQRRGVSLSEAVVWSQILRRRPFGEVGTMGLGFRSAQVIAVSSALLCITLVEGCAAKHPRAGDAD